MSIKINIVDTGATRYSLETPYGTILGRKYDHNAEEIEVSIPTTESTSTCYMIIETTENVVIDHKEVKASDDYKVKITQDMSKYDNILIGFHFVRTDSSKKESDYKIFNFEKALNPSSQVGVTTQQETDLDTLRANAFTDANLKANDTTKIQFKNIQGTVKKELDLSGAGQVQADMGETDSTKASFVNNKKTSNLTNDSNFVVDANYVHTDNNYTTAEKTKLAGINTSNGQETIQYSTMPTASSSYDGKIVQFIGTTTSSYKNGYFYKCGETTADIPASLTLTSTGTAGLGTLTGYAVIFGDKIDNYEDTYNFEYKPYPDSITVITASSGTYTLMRDRAEDANNRFAWLTSGGVSLWTTTQVPELGTEFFTTTTENGTAFISYDDVTVNEYSSTYGRWQRDLGDDFYEDVNLSEYGITYNGIALIGAKIVAVYTAEIEGNSEWVWQQINTQPSNDLQVKTSIDSILVSNTQYYLGERSSLALILPSSVSAGQIITVDFKSGSVATVLSISGNVAGNTSYAPSANTLVELKFKFDGTYWKLSISSVNVPSA